MKRRGVLILFILGIFVLCLSSAFADTNITYCSNITSAGVYYLNKTIGDLENATCVYINVNNVTLDCLGYAIDGKWRKGMPGSTFSGIKIIRNSVQDTNITIQNCNVTGYSGTAIYVDNAGNINFRNMTIFNNFDDGIGLFYSYYTNVTNSTFKYLGGSGIQCLYCNNSFFSYNIFKHNDNAGIYIDGLNGSIINSTFYNNTGGIYVEEYVMNSLIANCTIVGNDVGVYFYRGVANNTFYNNLFNNTFNLVFQVSPGLNNFSVNLTEGMNIAGGTFIGGNYWFYPNGTGYSEICSDTDRNGICDSPYDILADGTNIDNFPLATDRNPPLVTIASPTAQTYTSGSIVIDIRIDEAGSCKYSWDRGITNNTLAANSSNTGFTGTAGFSNGNYILYVYCNDTLGNVNNSVNVSFSISITVPAEEEAPGGDGGGCRTNWTCTSWSECANNIQTRNCSKKLGYCFAGNKPAESQSCSAVSETPATGTPAAETPEVTEEIARIKLIHIEIAVAIIVIVALTYFLLRRIRRI